MSHRNRFNPKYCAAAWPLQGAAGVITPDVMGNYPGTMVNAPTWGSFFKGGQAIELDGDDAHVNVGDVVELNAVSAFTLCFWMNQDVLDSNDIIFRKGADINTHVRISTSTDASGRLLFWVGTGIVHAYGYFEHGLTFAAGGWTHVAMVYDGSQTGNANRLVVYADAAPVALTFVNNIPAATQDLSGIDALIGWATTSFDGRFRDWRIYTVPLSRDEVIGIVHQSVPIF